MKWLSLVWVAFLTAPAFAADAPMDATSEESIVPRPIVSPLNFGLDLKYVPLQYPKVSSAEGHGVQIALEWLPIGMYKHYAGKPVIGASVGYGRIRDLKTAPGGRVSLNSIPVSAYVGYRLDFFDNQILVPFGKIARTRIHESRNPGGGSRYESWDYSLGGEICLNAIDPVSARRLDSSTGINNTYLVVEWTRSVPLDGRVQNDLSRDEWQIGLRFEM